MIVEALPILLSPLAAGQSGSQLRPPRDHSVQFHSGLNLELQPQAPCMKVMLSIFGLLIFKRILGIIRIVRIFLLVEVASTMVEV